MSYYFKQQAAQYCSLETAATQLGRKKGHTRTQCSNIKRGTCCRQEPSQWNEQCQDECCKQDSVCTKIERVFSSTPKAEHSLYAQCSMQASSPQHTTSNSAHRTPIQCKTKRKQYSNHFATQVLAPRGGASEASGSCWCELCDGSRIGDTAAARALQQTYIHIKCAMSNIQHT